MSRKINQLIRCGMTVANEKALVVRQGLFEIRTWQCPTLTWGNPTLPSALIRFTSEFGMESGGTVSLWLPGKNW